jgi:hypothetical protein
LGKTDKGLKRWTVEALKGSRNQSTIVILSEAKNLWAKRVHATAR